MSPQEKQVPNTVRHILRQAHAEQASDPVYCQETEVKSNALEMLAEVGKSFPHEVVKDVLVDKDAR